MISSTGNNIMGLVADKMKEINLSDDSGIDSPTGDMNGEISRNVKAEMLSDIIIKKEEESVNGFAEPAVDATVEGTCKAASKKSELMIINLCMTHSDISVLQQIYRNI